MTMGLTGLSSCSEEAKEEEELVNWQNRNDAFFASLEDSLKADAVSGTTARWQKFKSYSKNPSTEVGKPEDCIYVKVLKNGEGTECPMFNDSVRVSYQGRLIPSATYPEGFIFDGTVFEVFDPSLNGTRTFLTSSTNLIEGFATALIHMHIGDSWRVYIPYQLAYGSTDQTKIPAYSTLIFDIMLIDFAPAGKALPVWSARQM